MISGVTLPSGLNIFSSIAVSTRCVSIRTVKRYCYCGVIAGNAAFSRVLPASVVACLSAICAISFICVGSTRFCDAVTIAVLCAFIIRIR